MNDVIASWVADVMKAVRPILPKDFVGKVEINVFKGNISNINVVQSYKEDTAK